jgi:uncharacterized protein
VHQQYRARAARTGRQDYGDHVEQRNSEEVFAPESMATWVGAPVTVGHVAWITAENVQDHAVGYVRSVTRDRDPGDGTEYVSAELVITSPQVAARIDAGDLVEISAGYSTDLVERRQTQIRINHVALGPRSWARCGNACAIAR